MGRGTLLLPWRRPFSQDDDEVGAGTDEREIANPVGGGVETRLLLVAHEKSHVPVKDLPPNHRRQFNPRPYGDESALNQHGCGGVQKA